MTYRAVIIDDEAWTREVIKSLGRWEALDIEIVGEASDGDFGIELIRQLKPEIVITDINMPKKVDLNSFGPLERQEALQKSSSSVAMTISSTFIRH